jgi:hypothetical protein
MAEPVYTTRAFSALRWPFYPPFTKVHPPFTTSVCHPDRYTKGEGVKAKKRKLYLGLFSPFCLFYKPLKNQNEWLPLRSGREPFSTGRELFLFSRELFFFGRELFPVLHNGVGRAT